MKKITRDRALEVTAYCRAHKLTYANEGTYPNTRKAAEKLRVRAPNGMLLHFPRGYGTYPNPRAYVLWKGEPLADIEEACAFILMTRQDRPQLIVLRCAEIDPLTAEDIPVEQERNAFVIDAIDSVE